MSAGPTGDGAGAVRAAAGGVLGYALVASVPSGVIVGLWLIGPALLGEAGVAPTWSAGWGAALGAGLSFRLDGLSWLMGWLIAGIGLPVLLYARAYLRRARGGGRFALLLVAFLLVMMALVTADNLLLIFVCWELTSLLSFLLIGFDAGKKAAREAARQAMLITVGGGLALLAGLVLLGIAGGTWSVSELAAGGDEIRRHPYYLAALVLVAAGAFTKSAQWPVHFWLPGAMAAPAPASAYLHSATMVKAGVFLLARLAPILAGTAAWAAILLPIGAITFFLGAWVGWREDDGKRMLAYTTVASLGTLVMLLGIGTPLAIKAALVLLVAHAVYKSSLFLVFGAIEKASGTRDLNRLASLRLGRPALSIAVVAHALAMAGLPPFLGFVAKEIHYDSLWHPPDLLAGWPAWLLLALSVVANAGLVAAAVRLSRAVLAGREPVDEVKLSPALTWGPELLAVVGLLAGAFVAATGSLLIGPALSAVAGEGQTAKLALWHGWTPPLLLSALTITAGLMAEFYRERASTALRRIDSGSLHFSSERLWDRSMIGLPAAAVRLARAVQGGRLRRYLQIVVVCLALLPALALAAATFAAPGAGLSGAVLEGAGLGPSAAGFEVGLVALALAATLSAVRASSRLAAVASLGVVGIAMAMLYMTFGAPDVAMTQIAVEALTVILLVLVLYRLPRYLTYSPLPARAADAAVALAVGALMAWFSMLMIASPGGDRLARYYAESSLPLAQGRNVVNVILVDFRALDTLGEVAVLAAAALGISALLKAAIGKEGAP